MWPQQFRDMRPSKNEMRLIYNFCDTCLTFVEPKSNCNDHRSWSVKSRVCSINRSIRTHRTHTQKTRFHSLHLEWNKFLKCYGCQCCLCHQLCCCLLTDKINTDSYTSSKRFNCCDGLVKSISIYIECRIYSVAQSFYNKKINLMQNKQREKDDGDDDEEEKIENKAHNEE